MTPPDRRSPAPFPTDWSSWGPTGMDRRHAAQRRQVARMPAERGLVVEETATGFTGAITGIEASAGIHIVSLEDRHGRLRSFPLGHGFDVEGHPVELVVPAAEPRPARPGRTASGSVAVHDAPARVARASRIWVEGTHDAELVEKVWGEDLRVEGVVVEPLHGADDLVAAVKAFNPSAERRVGVLLDHLVPHSKESRIAAEAMRAPGAAGNVLVLGHPYVDVWQAVKPQLLGLRQWPQIPRSVDIKIGTLQALGWPHGGQRDIARGWKQILGRVSTYADLEPALLGRVEELIDFVTVD